jgi:pyruvate,water dikinase
VSALVVWAHEPAATIAAVGAKMARLAELARAGVDVPRWFAVTVDAYRRQCTEAGPDEQVIPPVRAAIVDAYRKLSAGGARRVAVRSSATGEDSADASFAGMFHTVLGVSGTERVVAAVQECWRSLDSPHACAYRGHRQLSMAVGVAELVDARAAGVAFSAHPVTGRRDRLVIEATWGWGEALAKGLVTPDHAEVGRDDRRVLRYDVGSKEVMSAFDAGAGRVVEKPTPQPLRGRAVLDSAQLGEIVGTVLGIEAHFGYPRGRRVGTGPVRWAGPDRAGAPGRGPAG